MLVKWSGQHTSRAPGISGTSSWARVEAVEGQAATAGFTDAAGGTARYSVVARSTLPEEIAARLLALIRARELRPGDKLPAERALAGMMEVSRPVLREALRALALMKVVDIRQGSGTYVTSLEPTQLVSHLEFAFSTDSIALVQLLEARRVVEVGNVRLAALRIGEPGIRALESILSGLHEAVDAPVAFGDLDIAFHDAICTAAGNFLLTQFMAIINTLGRVSRARTGALRSVREATLRDHGRILEALWAGDADAAAAAMREHLDHVEQSLDSSIEHDGRAVEPAATGPAA